MSTEPTANASLPGLDPVVDGAELDDEDIYESGGEDDEDQDADYQDGEGDEEEEGDEEGEEGAPGENLTHLLIAKDGEIAEDDEDEDEGEDEPYVPGGGVEPAEQEIDGDEHDINGETNGAIIDDNTAPAAVGLKRKTSGEEEEEPEVAEGDQDAKRVKV